MFTILYAGFGALGYETSDLTDTDNLIVDAGIGFELGFTARNTDVILTFIYAQPLHAPDHIDGGNFVVSARTIR